MQRRIGDWFQTYSGIKFYAIDPRVILPYDEPITPWGPLVAEEEFIKRFEEITRAGG